MGRTVGKDYFGRIKTVKTRTLGKPVLGAQVKLGKSDIWLFMKGTVDHKSHDPCFRVFLMDAGVITFVAHCTPINNHIKGELSKRHFH